MKRLLGSPMHTTPSKKFTFFFIAIFLLSLAATGHFASADTADQLRAKIAENSAQRARLDEEIKSYQTQIEAVSKQADSLKNTLIELDLTRKSLEASIRVTQNKIDAASLEISRLALNIGSTQNDITDNRRVIAGLLNEIYQKPDRSVPLLLLAGETVSDTLDAVEKLSRLESGLHTKIDSLEIAKANLESNKRATEAKKAELVTLTEQLGSQKKIVAQTSAEKQNLLTSTKNTEADYRRTLADKIARKEAFEKELLEFESALKLVIDPSSIPHTGTGVLQYPLDKVRITQYFGNTSFSTANPQIYNGKGHTGLDFAASIGTPVKSALSGTVVGVANTDLVAGCYSYGKWIMVKHNNGLSTLYAHLSLQNVSVGQEVSTGQVLGYSGNTGFSTGPHLHFGVYATQGVQITKFTNSKNCNGATIPLADLKAYLNPLSFL